MNMLWVLGLLTCSVIVLAIVGAFLIVSLRKNTAMLKSIAFEAESDEVTSERFNGEKAEQWFEKGELKALNRYCESFIESFPNSVHANWYYALSHFNQGDYDVAREYFENVICINPLWREGASVYLQEINNRTAAQVNRTVH